MSVLLAFVVLAADRPNILLAISDDQSYPHASAYGSTGLFTPAFDRVAAGGALFTEAYAASPGCAPSRAGLLTGMHPWSLEQAGTHASSFPKKFATYPERLAEAGYHVGHTGKGWGPGNYKIDGRSQNPAGPAYNRRTLKAPVKGISNKDYAANFADFLADREDGQPFCFWYGGHEPHREFKRGYGLGLGKSLAHAETPNFLPDTEVVRSDMLDYFAEIEWFDRHLGQMLDLLEEAGELDNTIVIVTSDNGMSFPRAKANCYEYGIHVPLAIQWPASTIKGGQVVRDVVGFVDLTATITDAAGLEPASNAAGQSLLPRLLSGETASDDRRFAAFSSRERHSSSRHNNSTYPQRSVRLGDFLLINNDRPDRWPAGDPQKYNADGTLGPEHGGYHDIDACPTLTELIERRSEFPKLFRMSVGKRPAIEFYNLDFDPDCLINLAEDEGFANERAKLQTVLDEERRRTGDPRMTGDGDIFETYKRYSRIRKFPKPPATLPD